MHMNAKIADCILLSCESELTIGFRTVHFSRCAVSHLLFPNAAVLVRSETILLVLLGLKEYLFLCLRLTDHEAGCLVESVSRQHLHTLLRLLVIKDSITNATLGP